MSKLRILCLHGFSSNGSVHAYQVRSTTSHPSLSANYEFIFPSGPHDVDIKRSLGDNASTTVWSKYVSENSTSGHRAWWFAVDPKPSTSQPGTFRGLEQALDVIGNVMREGEVDAIWGFSQGACLAGMLMGSLSPQNKEHELRKRLPESQGMPMAGVFFSSFKARFEQYDGVYAYGIKVPTLHVLGARDVVVTEERSEVLMGVCESPRVLRHGGGHDIPGREEDQEVIVRFLIENVRKWGRESL